MGALAAAAASARALVDLAFETALPGEWDIGPEETDLLWPSGAREIILEGERKLWRAKAWRESRLQAKRQHHIHTSGDCGDCPVKVGKWSSNALSHGDGSKVTVLVDARART